MQIKLEDLEEKKKFMKLCVAKTHKFQKLNMKTLLNENKNRKMSFTYVLEHCASFVTIILFLVKRPDSK